MKASSSSVDLASVSKGLSKSLDRRKHKLGMSATSAMQSPAPDEPIPENNIRPTSAESSPMPDPKTSETARAPSQIDEESQQHGPRFLAMSADNRKLAIRLHKNLGHPDSERLSKVLQHRGYRSELSQGVLDLKCSVCQMQQRPKLQRPATLRDELQFGDKNSMDGVKWVNRQGQEYHFYHFIDHGTNCHTAVIAPNRAEIEERFTAGWLNWLDHQIRWC